jgi:hypothetical protein
MVNFSPGGQLQLREINFGHCGTDVVIFKILSPKNLVKHWRLYKILILRLCFEKNAIFFAEIVKNRQKM